MIDSPHCFKFRIGSLASLPDARTPGHSTVWDTSSAVQSATPDDFLLFLVDGPLRGLDKRELRIVHELWHHPSSVQSYAQCLPRPQTCYDYRPGVN